MSLFTFRQRYGNLEWSKIKALDIDDLISNSNLGTLQQLVDSVTFSNITSADLKDAPEGAVLNLVRISQLMLEYLLTGQEQQAEQIQTLYYKHSTAKQKYKKLETANVRLREDLNVYKAELAMLHKAQENVDSAALHRNTGGTPIPLLGDGTVDSEGAALPRKVQPPKVIRAGTGTPPLPELPSQTPQAPAAEPAASTQETAAAVTSVSASAEEKNADEAAVASSAPAPSDPDPDPARPAKAQAQSAKESDPAQQQQTAQAEAAQGESEALGDKTSRRGGSGRRNNAKPFGSTDLALLRSEAEAEGIEIASAGSDDSESSSVAGDEENAEKLPAEEEALEKVLGHHDIDLKLHIARLFEQQRELIEQKIIRKEDAISVQLEGMQGTVQQVQIKDLCSRVDALAELMQSTLGTLQQGQTQVSGSASASVTASPFRKKARSTPDTSVDGIPVQQDVHSGSGRGTVPTSPKPHMGDYLQQAAEELYDEEVEFDNAKRRNSGLSKREAAIVAREAALEDRESHARLREQGIKASLAKLDFERDQLEVNKAIAFRSPRERTTPMSTGTTGTGTTAEDFEFTLSPSPLKASQDEPKPSAAVSPTPQQMPPAKKPKRPSTASMATSTTALESIKEAETVEAKKKEIKIKFDLAAKIIMARIGQHNRFRVNRGFRKWLDKTVDAREAENYHLQYEAERKAEVSAALLARGREKEKQLSEQLKIEREQLKKKDEEMKQRLDAERQREKERYEAILADADPERAAANKNRRASAVLLEDVTRTSQEAATLLAAAEQEEESKKRQTDRDAEMNENGNDVTKVVETIQEQPTEDTKPSKPDRTKTSSADIKPGKPVRKSSADTNPKPAKASPAKAPMTPTKVESPEHTHSLACVFEHGANVRDSPSKSAKTIGEIDKGHVVPGTGRTQVEPNGLMYVELAKSPQHPVGGWVPVRTHGGQPVMQEHTSTEPVSAEKPKNSLLRYRCVFIHGAFVRDTPSRNADNVGEIDEHDIVTVTGKVETDTGGTGITYVQLEVCKAYPKGGWVPLMSKAGHTVMEPYGGTPEQRRASTPEQSDSGKSNKSSKSGKSNSGKSNSGKASNAGGDDELLVDEFLEDVEDLSFDEESLFQRAQQRIAAGSSGKHTVTVTNI